MQHKVFGFGYQGQSVPALVARAKVLGARVIDVRLKAVSRNPAWNRSRLATALGDLYEWVPALGNRNYKGGPIELADPERGLEIVRERLSTAPVILMCVCREEHHCHRHMILTRLAEEGYATEQLPDL